MEILMHGYHLGLLGVVKSKAERRKQIRVHKPPSERELRLRLLQSVSLKLLPRVVIRAAKALDRAQNDWEKAWIKMEKAWADADKRYKRWQSTQGRRGTAVDKSKKFKEWEKANVSFFTMQKALDKARNDFLIVCRSGSVRPRLEALHEKLCVPDCPWDGERILPD